jgi:hypothetical protein
MLKVKIFNSILLGSLRFCVFIVLSLAIPLSVQGETVEEALARAEKWLLNPGAEIRAGEDLKCERLNVFKFYKMAQIMKYDNSIYKSDLCEQVLAYSNHFGERILSFWPFKEMYGFVVEPISKIEEFNAYYSPRPTLNRMTLSKFKFNYLAGTSVEPQKVIWTHEAGHAAFHEILDEYFYPNARKAFLKTILEKNRNSPINKKLMDLEKKLDDINDSFSELDNYQREIAYKKIGSLTFQIASLRNKMNQKDPSNSMILAAFDEFFADLFAVFFYGDLNIIGNSFDELGLKTNPSDFRRFNPKSGVKSAVGWTELESHVLLTPARHYFGQHIFSKIKNPRLFLVELAQYFIQALENPIPSMFISYKPLIWEVQKSENADQVASVIEARQKRSEIFSWSNLSEIKNFCEMDLKACKNEILEQLNRGQDGIFLTNVIPENANLDLIQAMEAITQKLN